MDIYFMYLDMFIFPNKIFDFCSKTQFTTAGWIVTSECLNEITIFKNIRWQRN